VKTKHQHSEQWLDGAIHQVELLCKQAAEYPNEYEVPTHNAVQSAQRLLNEFKNAENPQIALTQDGEFVVTWTHFCDKFKAIVRDDGQLALFENKNKVDHDSFVRRLTQVPA